MQKKHIALYAIEFLIIGGGFAILLSVNPPIYSQLLILGVILLLYCGIGLFHHAKHKDIRIKVVLEYILVSVLIFSLFIFLNIGKI